MKYKMPSNIVKEIISAKGYKNFSQVNVETAILLSLGGVNITSSFLFGVFLVASVGNGNPRVLRRIRPDSIDDAKRN